MKKHSAALIMAAFATLTVVTIPLATANPLQSRNNVFCARSSPAMANTPEARARYEASEQRYRACMERARLAGQPAPVSKPKCQGSGCPTAVER